MLWMPRTTTETVFAEIVHDLYDRPVMAGSARTVYVRHLVLAGLGDGFRRGLTADIERVDGRAIVVRQAAALDAGPYAAPRSATFAIDDLVGLVGEDAAADLLILAWHGIANRATADQRDPSQWRFAAVPVARLPAARTLEWSTLEALAAPPVAFTALREETRRTLATLPSALVAPPGPHASR